MPVVARRVQEEDGPSYTILREIPATGPSSFKESPTPPRGNCWWPLECSMLCVLWKARTTSLPPRPPARHSHVTGSLGPQTTSTHSTLWEARDTWSCAHLRRGTGLPRRAAEGNAGQGLGRCCHGPPVHLTPAVTDLASFLPAHANHPHGERPPRIIARRRSERVSRWHPRGSAFVGGGGRPRQPRSARRR